MERREFLKSISILSAAFALRNIPDFDVNSHLVYIYYIKDKEGKPYIMATRFKNKYNKWWSASRFDLPSFVVLEKHYDSETIPQLKKKWFDHYGIEYRDKRNFSFSPGSVKGGCKGYQVNKQNGNLILAAKQGGKIGGPKAILICKEAYIKKLADPIAGKQIREGHSNRIKSQRENPEWILAMKKAHANSEKKKLSELANMRKATDKIQEIVTCPECGKEGNYRIMKRWHFERCGNPNAIREDIKKIASICNQNPSTPDHILAKQLGMHLMTFRYNKDQAIHKNLILSLAG